VKLSASRYGGIRRGEDLQNIFPRSRDVQDERELRYPHRRKERGDVVIVLSMVDGKDRKWEGGGRLKKIVYYWIDVIPLATTQDDPTSGLRPTFFW
jgi:hypothetical protein